MAVSVGNRGGSIGVRCSPPVPPSPCGRNPGLRRLRQRPSSRLRQASCLAGGRFGQFPAQTIPCLPFDPYPDLPVYLLPDGSWLVDDASVQFPQPPGPPATSPLPPADFLTQPSLASPMLNGAMTADDTGSTNSPPQDDDTDSTNSPPVLVDPGSVPASGTFWFWPKPISPRCPSTLHELRRLSLERRLLP